MNGAVATSLPMHEPARTEQDGVDTENSSDVVSNGIAEKQPIPAQAEEFVPNYLKGWKLHSISASFVSFPPDGPRSSSSHFVAGCVSASSL